MPQALTAAKPHDNYRKTYYQRTRTYVGKRSGPHRYWTGREVARLFDPDTLDRDLATELNRSVAAIQVARNRHQAPAGWVGKGTPRKGTPRKNL